ncbi:hypothetical protein [Hansschlegelia plantiphila]|uniref:Uncharacterized protein n=1 Tax=Hansschlegelia plantiphila TaxID=374655 RepID=A0A9W6J1Q5_9HYPH|nr:hypothetical protein [Hansschlegelia plantiphila]GLK69195.1 hypothetical protein GCM10008179_28330 [Hansschlegelia plantiphila]
MTDWTSELVNARLLEAADTCWRSPRSRMGPQAAVGYWPAFMHDFGDMVGWGEQRQREHRNSFWNDRSRPSAAALSREEEMRDLTNQMVAQGPRKILWGYAFSLVSGRPFDAWCRKHGFARASAYRALELHPQRFARTLCKSNVFLRAPDMERVRQIAPERAMKSLGLDVLRIEAEAA